MENTNLNFNTKEHARNRWTEIIPDLTGIHPSVLTNDSKPCPACGGKDRFRFDNIDGNGTWYCNQCGGKNANGGGGDGFSLIMRVNGCDFKTAAKDVYNWLNGYASNSIDIQRYKIDAKEKIVEIEDIKWKPIKPNATEIKELYKDTVSLYNPKKKKASKVNPTHVALLNDENGNTVGAVVRYNIGDKKIPCQVRLCAHIDTGETKWVMMGIGKDKPFYGIENTVGKDRVIIVFGERKKDIAQNNVPLYPFVSIVGGDNSVSTMNVKPLQGKVILIWPDNDRSGLRCAKRLAEMLVNDCTVKIVVPPEGKPDKWDLGDAFEHDGWTIEDFKECVTKNTVTYKGYENEGPIDYNYENSSDDLYLTHEKKEVSAATCTDLSQWPDPIDIIGEIAPPTPEYDIIPKVIGDFVCDQSEIIGCDPGAMLSACLVACAGALSDDIKLKPKAHSDSWLERACLWSAFVGGPSEKKTPAMSAALKPLTTIEKKLAQVRREELTKYNEAMEEWNMQRLRKGNDPNRMMLKPEKPTKTRYMVGSTTIEALQGVLSENPRGVIASYDELSNWFGSMDAYNKSGTSKDRPAWLEAYNGGQKSFDTVARGEVWVDNWSVSIFGGIQPEVIRKISKSLPSDGLLQRFFIICSTTKSNKGIDRKPEKDINDNYFNFIEWLLSITKDSTNDVVTLDYDAINVKNQFYDWAREMLDYDVLRGGLASHVGKYEGLYARLLLIWHFGEMYNQDVFSWTVSGETAFKCAEFIKTYLFKHALYFYNTILGGSDSESMAKIVAKHLLTDDVEKVSNRSIARKVKDWRDVREADKCAVMQVLDTYGWVLPSTPIIGNRMPQFWTVNPKIKSIYSEEKLKELKRSEMSKKILKDMIA